MNKVVLVTGGSKGIGEATVKVFASHGFDVVINYNSDYNSALKIKNKVEDTYGISALTFQCDVSDEEQVKSMIDYIIKKFKRLDVVVNNAGIAIDSDFNDKTKDNFRKILDVNLIGPFLVSKYAYKYITNGSIINISSTNGDYSFYPFSMDYDTSKAGLNLLTKNLAIEFAPRVRVNAVAPGWVNTKMNALLDNDFIDEENKKIVLNRFAEPVEIANVIYFLASDEASYINGEIINVDGGRK